MHLAQPPSDAIGVQTIQSRFGGASLVEWRDLDRIAAQSLPGWIISTATTQSLSDAAGWKVQEAIKAKAFVALASAWKRHVLNPSAPVDFGHVAETFDSILALIEHSGPRSLDMTGLDPASVNGELLVSALRASFRWRDQVIGWSDAVTIARMALEITKEANVELCLAGLE